MSNMPRMLNPSLAIVAIFIALSVPSLQSWLQAKPNNVVVDNTTTPKRTSIEKKVVATGSIAPRIEVRVKSHVSGVIDAVTVQPGQWVKAGEPVARIKPLPDPVDLNTTQKDLTQAGLSLARADVEFKRQRQLHSEGLISDEAFRDVQLKFRLAKETLASARRAVALKERGAVDTSSEAATQVVTTVSGMVLDKMVEPGDFIIKSGDMNEGTTIVTVADMNHLIFKGDVQEADSGSLRAGIPLAITVGALPEERIGATLEFIAPKARRNDQGRVTFEIRAAVTPKSGLFLRAGYSAVAELLLDRRDGALTIPESYLHFRADKPYVKVTTEAGTVEERAVTTGISDGLNLEVISGLTESDRLLGPDPIPAP